jgi:hypothetical protein
MLAVVVVVLSVAGNTVSSPKSEEVKLEATLREIANRGALVRLMAFGDGREIHITFPGGEARRQERSEGLSPPRCGLGVEREIEPPDTGPSMTDDDLLLLEAIPRLTWIDLSGTQVTESAVIRLRKRLRKTKVVWQASK